MKIALIRPNMGNYRSSDAMTPRTVVFSLPAQMTVAETRGQGKGVWPHSRIPVHDADDPENIVGIV